MFVKVCGITTEEDALLAVAMGADAVGFVFAPSTRQVSSSLARDIARRLPPEVLTVGVFRDEAPEQVVRVVQRAGLGAAQLSGHEAPAQSHFVRARIPFVIQGFTAGDPALGRSDEYAADALLVDSPRPGSGEVFDWSLAEGAPLGRRVILAGGLSPDNVAEAIRRVGPWGVDASTRLEVDGKKRGRKDPVKVRAFVANARAAVPAGYRGAEAAPYDWTEEP